MSQASAGRQIRWYGLDFGETIMNPFTLHQTEVIRSIYRELGRESEAEERAERWRRLRDSFGKPGDPGHLRVRALKQYARGRIYQEVFDNDPEASRLYDTKELAGFSDADGLQSALQRMREAGAEVNVVSEVTQAPAVQVIVSYLRSHGLNGYFHHLYTPAGLFTASGALLDGSFVGSTKRSGELYRKIGERLGILGLTAEHAMMIGDDPVLDVANAAAFGLRTGLYVGIIDRGWHENADVVIEKWSDFRPA